MKKIYLTLLVAFFSCVASSGSADNQATKNKMIGDLDSIQNTLELDYAPAEWKKTYFGWDLQTEIDLAKQEVLATNQITVKQFQRIVARFFKSIKDYHVSVHFYSTEAASLPFRVQGAEGRYFITWVDSSIMHNYPLKRGDEILTFGNLPIQEAIAQLKALEYGNPESATDQALAETSLTRRMASKGHIVPNGSVEITVKSPGGRQGGRNTHSYQMDWDYFPELVANRFNSDQDELDATSQLLAKHPFLCKKWYTPIMDSLDAFYKQKKARATSASADLNQIASPLASDEDEDPIGGRKSFVPILGPLTWESSSDSLFHAYIFKGPNNRRIGYIRIPSYDDRDLDKNAEEFKDFINLFQLKTDALVIDQVNNGGGQVFYMYGLLSILTNRPLLTTTEKSFITQKEVWDAISLSLEAESITTDSDAQLCFGESIFGLPVDMTLINSLKNYAQLIIDTWNAGKSMMGPSHLLGIESIPPNPNGGYTKPILVLINSLDFSCADFFPALLQDNKSATIFGSTTAGAGGSVTKHSYPNRFGIAFYAYTQSIAARANNRPIENYGVTPDIEYNITAHDLQNNFAGYKAAVNDALKTLLPVKEKQNAQHSL